MPWRDLEHLPGELIPLLTTWFKSLGHEDWYYYYLTGMIGISLVVYLFMCDTKADSAMHRHE
jgi:MFS transporter, MHS family, alpha-ketoglutarate permease